MKLPNGNDAVVPVRKLTEYLLSESHPVGSSKAAFFRGLGFGDASIALLENGLPAILRDEDVVEVMASPHGTKYVVDGRVETPLGGLVAVRTVWIVEPNELRPRFVTAYPK
jgi:hypothetical protein